MLNKITKYNLDELKSKYINQKFNYLTITDVIYNENKSIWMFKCICDCGNEKVCTMYSILFGHTKSCGCYNSSQEKANKQKEYYKQHPNKITKMSVYYIHHPKVLENIKHKREKYYKQLRVNSDFEKLLEIINPKYKSKLLSGDITSNDIIETKCPNCSEYGKHKFSNVFIFYKNKLKHDHAPLCNKCREQLITSSYEKEIEEFIKSFYDGEIVRNTREIISPQELDIYIPDKKIAIEFNGDYYHSSEFKDNDYHVNKYLNCKVNGILLVSIFESEWNNNKDSIKEYIYDLFNNKENKLSFNEDKTLMNNNYPHLNIKCSDNIISDSYLFKNNTVYTCGYSQIIY